MNRLSKLPELLCLLVLPLVLCGDSLAGVLVVDAAGGAGVDFLSIQPAIDAAVDGDTILLATGTYTGFGIHGKGISVVAAPAAQVDLTSEIAVRNIAAGQQVTLVGLDVANVGGSQRGLVAANSAGPIWVEDCHLEGHWGTYLGQGVGDSSEPGILAVDCDHLVLMRCDVFGGNGLPEGENQDNFWHWGPGRGNDGLQAERSQVYVFGGHMRGGWGAGSDDGSGNDGGYGVRLSGDVESTLFVEGARLTGGDGGGAGWSGGLGGNCGDGGRAGHSLSAPGLSTGYARDTIFAPGVGGAAGGSSCSSGANGQDIAPVGHSILALGGLAYTMKIESPVSQGSTALLEAKGMAGDQVWAQVALNLDPAYLPAISSQRLIGLPRRLIFLGVAGTDGLFRTSLPMPTLANPFGSFRTNLQGYFRSSGGAGQLGSGGHLLVLGSAF